ncbi:hypothetical protein AVEN_92306-1 [Araneus ventricosus]|uniref:Uncharacterized protein n=1 Tax=Araneus ventricosus TaxID=182803 RepID=A0A4Y2AMC6_ARAVE|nr:hypothetical protein AVEN_92306-1 [Araneus ventricosus]
MSIQSRLTNETLVVHYYSHTKTSAAEVCERHFKDCEVLRNSTIYNEETGKTISAPVKRLKLEENAVPSILTGCP